MTEPPVSLVSPFHLPSSRDWNYLLERTHETFFSMKTPRFSRAFEMPRRSFLNLVAVTFAAFAAKRLQAQSAERKPPIGDGKLRIIVFGAHPDDCELSAGGTGAKWAAQGHHVKFVSCTNGTSAIGAWRAGPWLDAAPRKSRSAPGFWETNPRCSTSTTANSW